MSDKMWGGRFSKRLSFEAEQFTHSIQDELTLIPFEIQASIAHARMLGEQKIITRQEAEIIIRNLDELQEDIASKVTKLRYDSEDIHSFIEEELKKRIGDVAGKLHTARSRNDQAVTDTRLFICFLCYQLSNALGIFEEELISISKQHLESVMPGLTHQQHAQPVSLAHYLLAYFWMFHRDRSKFREVFIHANMMPLGACALAGTSLPIDRQQTAQELHFIQAIPNSIDAVADRDFVVEFLTNCALIMTHLSRLSQELINWSSPEFGFLTLDDSYTTGSSIMPQKKNADVCELIRSRTARVNSNVLTMLTILKGLPLSYNRDFQDDKMLINESFDITHASVQLTENLIKTAKFHTQKMADACKGDFSTATELADYLVIKGVPFREAHEIVGKIVRDCIKKGKTLEDLDIKALKKYSSHFEVDVIARLDPMACMKSKTSEGGTAPEAVKKQLRLAEIFLVRDYLA